MSDSLPLVERHDSLLNRALPGLLAGGAAIGITLLNPGDSGVTICASKGLFGIDCPLCGGLRCVNSLMRGHFLAAADHNVILAVALPLVAATWLVWLGAQLFGHEIRVSEPPRWLIGTVAVLLLAFTVVRNVGGPAWAQWLGSGLYQ